jgi:hypothetical protein
MSRARGRQFGDAGLFLRTTMLERRRKVMADWAAFLAGESRRGQWFRSRAAVEEGRSLGDARRLDLKTVWRAPAPRWRRNPPVGFIRPCEPTLVDRPPTGPGWLYEVKHDGFRVLTSKQGEQVKNWSRRGADFTYRFPTIVEAVRGLACDSALIDGEAVVLRNDGWSDFGALMDPSAAERKPRSALSRTPIPPTWPPLSGKTQSSRLAG